MKSRISFGTRFLENILRRGIVWQSVPEKLTGRLLVEERPVINVTRTVSITLETRFV